MIVFTAIGKDCLLGEVKRYTLSVNEAYLVENKNGNNYKNLAFSSIARQFSESSTRDGVFITEVTASQYGLKTENNF